MQPNRQGSPGQSSAQHRVCLVGAGFVSDAHAQALAGLETVETVAVCDTDSGKAESFAARHGLDHAFTSVADAIASGSFDRAHVLVPPSHHVPVARQLIEAGIGVLVEKPLGISSEECRDLIAAAAARGVPLGVNHNAAYFPAYLEIRRQIEERSLGRLQHLTVVRNLPARALPGAGHWVLRQPQNMIFESAVHPLSQIHDLAGPLVSADATVSGRHEIGPGQHYFDTWQASLVCERATAQLLFSYVGAYPTWQLMALCEDGMLTADLTRSRVRAQGNTRWAGYVAPLQTAGASASRELRQGAAGFGREALSMLGVVGPQDLFSASMRKSVAAFYRGPSAGLPDLDGAAGAEVVDICEAISRPYASSAPSPPPRAAKPAEGRCDALILGGTGFIGRSLVAQLAAQGLSVRVLARTVAGLPSQFDSDLVQVAQGDIVDAEAVSRAIAGARVVVHLAHGGSFDAAGLEASMVGPVSQVAEACLSSGVERLVFAGSIASLYLDDPRATITGATPNGSDRRILGDYGWAKARSEEILSQYEREQALPLCVVRPGIVIGEGGAPLHPGLGQWRGGVHCVGWNSGTNPMPLVLVSDVARAIALAMDSEAAAGKTYNLVGDVRLSSRECVAQLKAALERPLSFHPRHPAQHQAVAASKWLAKEMLGREAQFPSYRMFKSLACESQFDCSDVKADLGWSPCEDREELIERGFRSHSRAG
jgi:predicted dehydrogenase/nucleoside-diphosphate-sugar epimerase